MKHVDVAVIAATLWLLASMVLDILTPTSITALMIAAALAPPFLIGIAHPFCARISQGEAAQLPAAALGRTLQELSRAGASRASAASAGIELRRAWLAKLAAMTDVTSPTRSAASTPTPANMSTATIPPSQAFARAAVPRGASTRESASRLYTAVRDGIRYNPYVSMRSPESYRASSVLAAGNGYCVGKAALYAAACRVHGIPARVGFADVRNHLTTEKLRAEHGLRPVHLARLHRSVRRRRLAQGDPDLQRHAVRQARRHAARLRRPLRRAAASASMARAVPTCNTSTTTAAITTFRPNS